MSQLRSKPPWKSKKWLMSVLGSVAELLLYYFGVPLEITLGIGGLIISYVISQGIADHGKEKVLTEANVKAWVHEELSKRSSSSG